VRTLVNDEEGRPFDSCDTLQAPDGRVLRPDDDSQSPGGLLSDAQRTAAKPRAEGRRPPRMDHVLQQIEQEIPRLRRYARYLRREPDHADDLVQECLSRAIAKIDTWQPGTNLRAWLFVILRNCHINEIRREQRIVSIDDESPASGPTLTVPGSQETRVALAEVRNAYLSLSEEHREVLLLVAIEGLQYEEASAILDVPLGTVRSRLSRARQALRQALDAGYGVAGNGGPRTAERSHV
jgi:RNA polymerase sigma-70 factor, ECF subfamily